MLITRWRCFCEIISLAGRATTAAISEAKFFYLGEVINLQPSYKSSFFAVH
jgi:hypothetical protein